MCGFCALAVQFFAFSVLRTRPDGGRHWFLHTYDLSTLMYVTQHYTLNLMNQCIAQNQPMEVFGDWSVQTDEGAILSLLWDMPFQLLSQLTSQQVPMNAFFFSNDMRRQYLFRREVPPEVVGFFSALAYYPAARQQFHDEVLKVPKLGAIVSRAILDASPIIRVCLQLDAEPFRLRGGWQAHKLYAEEVLGMSTTFLQAVESVGARIAQHEDVKKWIRSLQQDYSEVLNTLLRLVKDGFMIKEEYYLLGKGDVLTTRDYLLGVIFALQNGESLTPSETTNFAPTELHPLIPLVEQVGARIVAQSERVKQTVQNLRSARNPDMIRRALLRTVQEGVVRWREFIQLCPPTDANTHFLARDYLLAYLFDTARSMLPEEETLMEEGGQHG